MRKNEEDIKNNVLMQLQKIKEENEAKRLAKILIESEKEPKPRDNEYANNWQKKSHQKKRDDGYKDIFIFLDADLVAKIDQQAANRTPKTSRSVIIGEMVEFYYQHKEQE